MPASQANVKTASTAVDWMPGAPDLSGDYDRDAGAFSTFWLRGFSYLDRLPGRAERSETEQADAAALLSEARQARCNFLGTHVGRVYRDLTDGLRSFRGRMICDRIVEPERMDQAIDEAIELLTNSGAVNASSNRKAIRMVQEPLDVFRTYMAVYAREQAYCHFSPALVSNLERFWNARQRKP